jgi:hypothetical protein
MAPRVAAISASSGTVTLFVSEIFTFILLSSLTSNYDRHARRCIWLQRVSRSYLVAISHTKNCRFIFCLRVAVLGARFHLVISQTLMDSFRFSSVLRMMSRK